MAILLYVTDQQLEMILVLAWIRFKWFRLHTAASHKHSKVIVSMTWLSRCDLFVWPFCPSLSYFPFTRMENVDTHTHSPLPTQQMTQSVFQECTFLECWKICCGILVHPCSIVLWIRLTDRQKQKHVAVSGSKLWEFLPWAYHQLSSSSSSSSSQAQNVIRNWSHFLLQQHTIFHALFLLAHYKCLDVIFPPETFCCCIKINTIVNVNFIRFGGNLN